MSLGWQTESALLPSKAKPIKVGDKSMLGLKAVLFEKEQLLKNKGQRPTVSRLLGKRSFGKSGSDNAPSSVRKEEDPQEKRAQDALAAKAKLYDDILEGKVSGESALVDFSKKKRLSTAPSEIYAPDPSVVEERKEVHQPRVVYGYGPEQWQWSKGTATAHVEQSEQACHDPEVVVEEWRSTARAERALQKEADLRVEAQLSEGARVKTQWEKTLQSSSRGFADEVQKEIYCEKESVPGDGGREERLALLKARRLQLGLS